MKWVVVSPTGEVLDQFEGPDIPVGTPDHVDSPSVWDEMAAAYKEGVQEA